MGKRQFEKALSLLLCTAIYIGMIPVWALDQAESNYEELFLDAPVSENSSDEVFYYVESNAEETICEDTDDITSYTEGCEYPVGTAVPISVVFLPLQENVTILVYSSANPDGTYTAVDPQTDGSYLLMPGDYLVDAFCDGYVPLVKFPLSVLEGSGTMELPFAMTALGDAGAEASEDFVGEDSVLMDGTAASALETVIEGELTAADTVFVEGTDTRTDEHVSESESAAETAEFLECAVAPEALPGNADELPAEDTGFAEEIDVPPAETVSEDELPAEDAEFAEEIDAPAAETVSDDEIPAEDAGFTEEIDAPAAETVSDDEIPAEDAGFTEEIYALAAETASEDEIPAETAEFIENIDIPVSETLIEDTLPAEGTESVEDIDVSSVETVTEGTDPPSAETVTAEECSADALLTADVSADSGLSETSSIDGTNTDDIIAEEDSLETAVDDEGTKEKPAAVEEALLSETTAECVRVFFIFEGDGGRVRVFQNDQEFEVLGNGSFLLPPGTYDYHFHDETEEYDDQEGSFTVEPNSELAVPLTLVKRIRQNSEILDSSSIQNLTAPTITADPSDMTIGESGTAIFYVAASGSDLSYQWQYRTASGASWKAATASGNKTATLTVPGTAGRSGYQYRCMVTNSAGSVYSNAATLTVELNAPVITAHPTDVTVNEGNSACFSVTVTGSKLSYQWQYRTGSGGIWKSATASGNKTATLTVPGTAGRSGYQYRCMVANSGGTVYSQAATLTVELNLPVITAHPTDVTVNEGNSACFSVTVTGSKLSYQWQYRTGSDGSWKSATASGNKKSTLTVPGTAGRSGYQYRCKVTNSAGTVYSDAVTLTVHSPTYRALLVGEENFSPVCTRNRGDVTLMANMLSSVTGPTGAQYSVTKAYDLSSSQLLNAINSAFGSARDNDVSLFFIATHGDSVSSGEYAGALILADSSGSITSLKLDALADCLSEIPGKVIVILESCGSGAAVYENSASSDSMTFYANSAPADSEKQQAADAAFVETVIQAFAARDTVSIASNGLLSNTGEFRVESKFYVLTCSAYQQESWGTEEGPWNYFTKWLTNGIGTSGSMPADATYGNGDGALTLEEAYHYVSTVGDNYEFIYDGDTYTQQVKRYPEGSAYELFLR